MSPPRADAGHREIDHTADLGFEAWAGDLPGLYAEASLALAELCYDRARVEPRERRALVVEGASHEELLVRWLHEIYLLVEQEGWLTRSVVEACCGQGRLSGRLEGEPIDRERHRLHTEIKAITYHDLRVERDPDGAWRTRVIVDV